MGKAKETRLLSSSMSTELTLSPGMVNVGNTCFLNATMQVVCHLPHIRKLRRTHRNSCPLKNSSDCVACAVESDISNSVDGGVAFTPSVSTLIPIAPEFREAGMILGEQQCAHEFLTCMRAGLQRCNLTRRYHSRMTGRDNDIACTKRMKTKYSRVEDPDSIYSETAYGRLFMTRMTEARSCDGCGYEEYETLPTSDVCIYGSEVTHTMDETVRLILGQHRLGDGVELFCERCHEKRAKTSNVTLNELPLGLFVFISRNKGYEKDSTTISGGVEFLDVADYLSWEQYRNGRALLRLNGFVFHMGNHKGGHYISYSRHPVHQHRWMMFDNEIVTEVEADVAMEHAKAGYIFAYVPVD